MMREDECLLCRISQGKEPARIILKSETYIGFYNEYSRNYEDALVIPRNHLISIDELNDMGCYFNFVEKVHAKIQSIYKPDAIRIQLNSGKKAGQLFAHIHCNVIQYY